MDRLEEIDADKALYRLSLYGGDIQELAEVVEAEVEKLRYATPLTLTDLEVDMVEANSYQRRHRKWLCFEARRCLHGWRHNYLKIKAELENYKTWRISACKYADKVEADREKLIEALESVLIPRYAECETSKHYPVENCAEKGVRNPCNVCKARAVLKEVKND